MSKAQQKIYDKVNAIVISGLEKDGLSWFKSWKGGTECQPFNLITNRTYSGFNIFMLNAVARDNGYEFNQWLSFKQCSEKGGKVKKGSKATDVHYFKLGYIDLKYGKYVKDIKKINPAETYIKDGKSIMRYKKNFSIFYSKVFNVSQCEGIEAKVIEKPKDQIKFTPHQLTEQFISNYLTTQSGLVLEHKQSRAFYSPPRDLVNMPKKETFVDSDSYYKVLFHEFAHSTGHESRLNRSTLTDVLMWGDNTYAKEELVAEISAMYLCGVLGLNPHNDEDNSQAYINGWCKHLKDNKGECIFAMQQASKVVDFMQ